MAPFAMWFQSHSGVAELVRFVLVQNHRGQDPRDSILLTRVASTIRDCVGKMVSTSWHGKMVPLLPPLTMKVPSLNLSRSKMATEPLRIVSSLPLPPSALTHRQVENLHPGSAKNPRRIAGRFVLHSGRLQDRVGGLDLELGWPMDRRGVCAAAGELEANPRTSQ
ncbi:uncharacterized protein [Narcine bancroftii]|uniref:uncharacterized protein isoform X2 n=1 Tax=Narcine bancroftii TaxID=1343680 RepID=UPI003831FF3D